MKRWLTLVVTVAGIAVVALVLDEWVQGSVAMTPSAGIFVYDSQPKHTSAAQRTIPVEAPVPTRAALSVDHDLRIGSEGYGPWIDRALQQGDPELALSALQWLAACETNETLLKLVERQRGSSNTPPELIQATLESALQDQRRCQTVREDQLRTAGGRLSEIALQAGLPGAAVAYMNQHLLSLPADQHPRLRQLLARDARAGDVNALAMIDASGPRIGLSVYDQAVFAAASDTLGGRGALKTLWRQAFVALAQDLPEDQVQAARTEGEALARRINAGRHAPSGP